MWARYLHKESKFIHQKQQKQTTDVLKVWRYEHDIYNEAERQEVVLWSVVSHVGSARENMKNNIKFMWPESSEILQEITKTCFSLHTDTFTTDWDVAHSNVQQWFSTQSAGNMCSLYVSAARHIKTSDVSLI